ncbi:hypothetical protein ACPA54_37080 [Uniformispora flossi]|uniref:hypothetical protein n=1 Tax=Uniformispora flossi TaxID=3390723 RepID=UPI003C2D75FD
MRIESLERRVRELEQKADEDARYYELDGYQVVQVGRYAYRWRGEKPLEVGDSVLLPENYVSSLKHGPGPFVGTVSALGTTYRGSLSTVIRRMPSEP